MYVADTLLTLLSHPSSPPFIYLHHPHHPSSSALPSFSTRHTPPAILDAIEYYTSRLLYSGILPKLGIDAGEIGTWDAFVRELRVASDGKKKSSRKKEKVNGHVNGDGNGMEDEHDPMIVIITHAERLRSVLGGEWAVVTRLTELSGIPISVVLASSVPWDELRPPRGDAPEPIHVYLPPPTREDILQALLPGSSHPLYPRFLDLLIATILPLISSPILDLDYIAEALWPIYTASLPPHAEQLVLDKPYPDPNNPPPPLPITVKLLTDLKHQMAIPIAAAIEDLIPRQVGPAEFTAAMIPRPRQIHRSVPKGASLAMGLPLCAQYLIIAGYCASYNPAKSDLRLFGRGTGPDGKKRRGGGTRRAGYGRVRVGKVPQRLLGPKPFPLDRLLALFASLYAEHAPRPEDLQGYVDGDEDLDEGEDDGWLPTVAQAKAREERIRKKEVERDERWEDEVDHLTMSVRLWSMIPEMEAQGLLRRVSPVDRLDNVMLRCEVDYEQVKSIAKDLRITLDEYLYEATS